MKRILPILLCFAFAAVAPAQSPIAKKTEGMTRLSGFFPIYWDGKTGKMWLEINRWDKEFLYVSSLPAGVGSNDIGLDRGQLGGEKVVQFERSGPKKTGVTFDPMAAVESAASITLTQILHPERAARLIQYHARDPRNPGLGEVIDKVIAATWKRPRVGGLTSETQRVVDDVALYQLMSLASSDAAAAQARAIALSKIEDLKGFLNAPVSDPDQQAHYRFAQARIRRFLDDPKKLDFPKPMEPPPGQPIGLDR